MFYGKLVAGVIGLLVAGPIGLLVGVALGHAFDRGLAGNLRLGGAEQLARVQRSFFETCFLLLGHLAKADGRISREEIEHTETLFRQMRLDAAQRREAIDLFKRGAAPDFDPQPVVAAFMDVCRGRRLLTQTLLLFLVSLALADHTLDAAERRVLGRLAQLLGFGEAQLEQLLRMARAQEHFHGEAGAGVQPGTSLEDAYAALGVDPGVDDRELKRAYRRLMSEHHPDKLIARGVPEDMLRVATERAQEIQAAYDMVRRARGG
jgi:DnaJ like chaperone protein